MGIGLPWPRFRGAGQLPLRAGRVGVVDLGEVVRVRKFGLGRWACGGAARGFAGDSQRFERRSACSWRTRQMTEQHRPRHSRVRR